MKSIVGLNAFDPAESAKLGGTLGAEVARRTRIFGESSVLFYDRPLELVRGEGCWLYDADGVAYLDAYNNVPSVGHCHPHVVEAVHRQLGLLNVHSRYLHPAIMDYAERLLATMPSALSHVVFSCTGSESNDLALRLAAQFTGGEGVIVTEAAYHGNTASVTQVSPVAFKQGAPVARHVRVIPSPDSRQHPVQGLAAGFASQVEAAIADLAREGIRFSALLLDSIFSSDGVYADPPGFLGAAVDVVHRAQGLFIADEVQPGFCRTGSSWWGFQRHKVLPDIVTMGKPMGNGYPMSALVTRPEILDHYCRQVGYFNTFAASPVAAAAGNAVFDVIEREGLMANAARVGAHLRLRLQALSNQHPLIGEIRGAGLYTGVQLLQPNQGKSAGESAVALISAMRDRQVLIGAAGKTGEVLKLRPPLCFTQTHADQLVAALDDAIRQLA